MLVVSEELIPGILARQSEEARKRYKDANATELTTDQMAQSGNANKLRQVYEVVQMFSKADLAPSAPAEVYVVRHPGHFNMTNYLNMWKASAAEEVSMDEEDFLDASTLEADLKYKDDFKIYSYSDVKAKTFIGINGGISNSKIKVSGKLVVIGHIAESEIEVDGDLVVFGDLCEGKIHSKTSLYWLGELDLRIDMTIGRNASVMLFRRGFSYNSCYGHGIKLELGDNSSTIVSGYSIFPALIKNDGVFAYACIGYPRSRSCRKDITGKINVEKDARFTLFDYFADRNINGRFNSLPFVKAEEGSVAYIRASAGIDTVLIRKKTTLVKSVIKPMKVLVS